MYSKMSLIPLRPGTSHNALFTHDGVTTSTDAFMSVSGISGYPTDIVCGPGFLKNVYLVADGELADSWSAGTLRIRVYNQDTLIFDSSTIGNGYAAFSTFTDALAGAHKLWDISSLGSCPKSLTNQYNVLSVRITASAAFPAIDTECGVQLVFSSK